MIFFAKLVLTSMENYVTPYDLLWIVPPFQDI